MLYNWNYVCMRRQAIVVICCRNISECERRGEWERKDDKICQTKRKDRNTNYVYNTSIASKWVREENEYVFHVYT
jgi:hypothetical protein